jgi:hypothetical protein
LVGRREKSTRKSWQPLGITESRWAYCPPYLGIIRHFNFVDATLCLLESKIKDNTEKFKNRQVFLLLIFQTITISRTKTGAAFL